MKNKQKAIFLDRDGVINIEVDYLSKAEYFQFTENCIKALQAFQSLGYQLFIITNQSGIGRGYYTENDFHCLTKWMLAELGDSGITISQVEYCPHHPQDGKGKYRIDCDCRKPKPGMINTLVKQYNIDVDSSILIGDSITDIEAGKAANIKTLVLVESGKKVPKKLPATVDHLSKNLAEFANFLSTTE